jgi:hypothetical protein
LAFGGLSHAVRESEASAAGSAVSWLRGIQNVDGGFGVEAGDESSAGMTGWVALGLEGAGVNPLDLKRGGRTPISYLRANAKEVRSLGDLERTVLVLRGAGLGARGFGGRDLVAELRRARGADGSFLGQVNLTAFGVLALDAAGAGGNRASAAWLAAAQNPDGGWGFAPRTQSDADSTGAAMQALAAAGGEAGALRKAVGYLRAAERPGGGFPLAQGAVNSQSTAWAVQGLAAAGTNPESLRRGDGTPLGYLGARRAADGHYRYSSGSDQTPAWVTGQVLLAVNRKPFPLAPVARAATGATPSPAAAAVPASGAGGAAPAKSASGSGEAAPAAPPPPASQPAPAPGPTPVAAAGGDAEPARGGDDGTSPALLAAGAIAAGCALAAGGWLLYRRRFA